MKRAAIVGLALLLGGCFKTAEVPPPSAHIPPVPPEIVACAKNYGVKMPAQDLTVEQIERAWKGDRYKIVVLRQCLNRLIARDNELAARYR